MFQNRSTLRHNIIRKYRLIWGKWSPALQSKLEGNTDYTTHSPTYAWLWMFTKIKMCTSGIDHTSNGYHSAVIAMRTIFCLWKGRCEPIKAYYRRFEASISTSELKKCTSTKHVYINKTYTGGDDENITKKLLAMCLLMSDDYEWYSGIWNDLNKSALLGMENYPKTPTSAYAVLCHYKNPAPQRQAHTPPRVAKFV